MGVNISLYTADGKEWTDWDVYRHVGDRDFLPKDGLEAEQIVLSWFGSRPEDIGYRPIDFDKWRNRFCGHGAVNAERFKMALDFLETHPGSYYSYGI